MLNKHHSAVFKGFEFPQRAQDHNQMHVSLQT